QLVYASAIGFFFTAVFIKTGSILPCIISHIIVNATSAFALTPSVTGLVLIALLQTVLGVTGGLWLLRKK
ncbi:MAG: CPBP family intramembrane metalloprotease, partial [Oscillospiraceae bacterium]|nr:CPBP family intramembrane metalloprotease [Oscillospiraceae bacterium]